MPAEWPARAVPEPPSARCADRRYCYPDCCCHPHHRPHRVLLLQEEVPPHAAHAVPCGDVRCTRTTACRDFTTSVTRGLQRPSPEPHSGMTGCARWQGNHCHRAAGGSASGVSCCAAPRMLRDVARASFGGLLSAPCDLRRDSRRARHFACFAVRSSWVGRIIP